MNIAAFDIETTGLNRNQDRVIELAISGPSETHAWLIKHENIVVPGKITQITGITQDMIDRDGIPFPDAWEAFLTYLGSSDQIVGHNCLNFDWPFLQVECERYGIIIPQITEEPWRPDDPSFPPLIDTMALYKGLALGYWPQIPHIPWAVKILNMRVSGLKTNLAHASAQLKLVSSEALHRASADADLTLALAKAIRKLFPAKTACKSCKFRGALLEILQNQNTGVICAICRNYNYLASIDEVKRYEEAVAAFN